jgi:hypothetical protein
MRIAAGVRTWGATVRQSGSGAEEKLDGAQRAPSASCGMFDVAECHDTYGLAGLECCDCAGLSAVLVVDGTLPSTHDHGVSARSKNYRYSAKDPWTLA